MKTTTTRHTENLSEDFERPGVKEPSIYFQEVPRKVELGCGRTSQRKYWSIVGRGHTYDPETRPYTVTLPGRVWGRTS